MSQQAFFFGDWIKQQRELRGLTQADLSIISNNEIKQSTISMWENKKILTPSVRNIWIVATSLGIPLSEIPWRKIIFHNKNGEKIKVR